MIHAIIYYENNNILLFFSKFDRKGEYSKSTNHLFFEIIHRFKILKNTKNFFYKNNNHNYNIYD